MLSKFVIEVNQVYLKNVNLG